MQGPLYLPEETFQGAMAVLGGRPILKVLPLRKAKIGILVTGTETMVLLLPSQLYRHHDFAHLFVGFHVPMGIGHFVQ